MAHRNREAMIDLREAWRTAGLCVRCGNDRDDPDFGTCSLCRADRRARNTRCNQQIDSGVDSSTRASTM